MINIRYKKDNTILEQEFTSPDDASKFMAEHDVLKFTSDKLVETVANIATTVAINETLDEIISSIYAKDAINEVKRIDHPHGKKLAHATLDSFFKNSAPKYNSLQAVEAALGALYKQNGIEFEPNGLKQVISSYKKRLNEGILDEETLSSKETKKRDVIVKAMKKNITKFRCKYKDTSLANIHATAVAIVKAD